MAIGRTNCGVGGTRSKIPLFTYTGDYVLLDDGKGNWRIKFLTNGTFTPLETITVDAFLVGGGGSAGGEYAGNTGGGGSGFTLTEKGVVLEANVPIEVTIGSGGVRPAHHTGGTTGGSTTFGNFTVLGGNQTLAQRTATPGTSGNKYLGGDGASGGAAANSTENGVDGGNGADYNSYKGGLGQGTTTREFGEADGDLYASGGKGTGGSRSDPLTGIANTGNGGSGANLLANQEDGGSGIVVIRNHREAA